MVERYHLFDILNAAVQCLHPAVVNSTIRTVATCPGIRTLRLL